LDNPAGAALTPHGCDNYTLIVDFGSIPGFLHPDISYTPVLSEKRRAYGYPVRSMAIAPDDCCGETLCSGIQKACVNSPCMTVTRTPFRPIPVTWPECLPLGLTTQPSNRSVVMGSLSPSPEF
jgi:hypothetical protein